MEFNKSIIASDRGVSSMPYEKDKIILTNTNATLSDHFAKIKTRINGKYDKSPAFTISLDGVIYQHFDPNLYTNILNDEDLDKASIVIALENVGYLTKSETDGAYYDWKGMQYKGRVLEKSWRGKRYWAKYSTKQTNALIELVEYLCIENGIQKYFIGNNVSIHKAENLQGIFNRSNFFDFRHDLSPAMNFEALTTKINQNNNNEKNGNKQQ